MATGRADEGHVGYAGKLDDLADGSFDVVLYRLVLHHLVFQGPLAPIFSEAARLLAPGGALVAIEPGLWHPVGLGLALANETGVGERGARHAATTSRCRRGVWSPRLGRPACVPEIHAVTYTWRRMPPGLQRSLQPLDALGSRPRAAVFGHTLMLIARRPDDEAISPRPSPKGADTLAAVSSMAPASRDAASAPRRCERLRTLAPAGNNQQRGCSDPSSPRGFVLVAFLTAGGTDLGPTPGWRSRSRWSSAALAAAVTVFGAPGRAWGGVTLLLFAALAALTYVSIAWSVQPDNSWIEANRTLVYLAAFGRGDRDGPDRARALAGAARRGRHGGDGDLRLRAAGQGVSGDA